MAACSLALLAAMPASPAASADGRPRGGGVIVVAGPGLRCDPDRSPTDTGCPGHRPPGSPDRDARPFDGTLGRPCAYRRRFTPSGTRRVRVCF